MVGGETEPHGTGWVVACIPVDVGFEAVGVGLALCYAVEHVVQFPGIGGIESGGVQPGFLSLCEEIQLAGAALPEAADDRFPEIFRHLVGHVAAEAVHSAVYPELHALLHLPAHVGVGIVELCDVGPVIFHYGVAVFVAHIPVRVFFRDPRVVRGRVVGHPVENHL